MLFFLSFLKLLVFVEALLVKVRFQNGDLPHKPLQLVLVLRLERVEVAAEFVQLRVVALLGPVLPRNPSTALLVDVPESQRGPGRLHVLV